MGERLIDLSRHLLAQALMRPLVIVVPVEPVTQRLQLVDRDGGTVVD